MTDFRFAEPAWGQLLWLLLLFAIAVLWLESRGNAALGRFLSKSMQSRLVSAVPYSRRLLAAVFLLGALASLVLAAMRPQWGSSVRVLPNMGARIMICVDVSKSMLAEDVVPNRLQRAKAEIKDLLDLLSGEQVGLIAFAGKAAVVSPMTSDFSFLRLMLDNIGPHTVGLGGTRLEEPIRLAVNGFAEAADVSRVILLITDGEDHDSYPLEAAELARERGIKIITVGFGDEAGSKIQVTDPQTGVRSFVKDSAGNPVISRLDGDMLREIALRTEGAYIPAGTGALDLTSIHQQHIKPLMRGETTAEQIIRNEAYQWFVLLAFVLLATAQLIRRTRRSPGDSTKAPDGISRSMRAATLAIAGGMAVFIADGAIGQQVDAPASAAEDSFVPSQDDDTIANASADELFDSSPENSLATEATSNIQPRAVYNQALDLLDGQGDRAESLLQDARERAGTDGELRYRAAFNLGWVQIHRADAEWKDEPKQALQYLHSAADCFREAIRIRPEDDDARYNLEIVMRRAMQLADALAQRETEDVAKALDDLIQREREIMQQSAALIERLHQQESAQLDSAPPQVATPIRDTDSVRREFRALATQQRLVLSDAEALTQRIAQELDALRSEDAKEMGQDAKLRMSQLQLSSSFVGSATQRMGQTRSQFRRRQDQRGFRRASRALDELKRARDALRNPRKILQRILSDAKVSMRRTERKSQAMDGSTPAPAWITSEYLEESQTNLQSRAQQWSELMKFVLDSASAPNNDSSEPSPDPAEKTMDPKQLERLRSSVEMVRSAGEYFGLAAGQVMREAYSDAMASQVEALTALVQALENFLDLRGLIEASFATQKQLQATVERFDSLASDQQVDAVSKLAESQAKNLQRASRIAEEIASARQQLEAGPGQASDPASLLADGSNERKQAEQQRLNLADDLLAQAVAKMTEIQTTLSDTGEEKVIEDQEEAMEPGLSESLQPSTTAAVDRLMELRRLFFSIVEHLRETAQRQSDLNDDTQQIVEFQESRRPERLAPIIDRQRELEDISRQLAKALQQQASQVPETTRDPMSPPANPAAAEQQKMTQQFAQAAEATLEGATQMKQAHEQAENNADIGDIFATQTVALEKLLEALELLQPPNNDDEDQQQQQDDQSQQDQQEQQQQQQDMSTNQLLQLIRDREAQRQRDQRRRAAAVSGTVEKDW